jgi:uncharacterized membrane protein YcaP (DUF421 family)
MRTGEPEGSQMADVAAALGAPLTDLTIALAATVAIYLWVIGATRLAGLRSFSKMSAFDFAMTVAIGSIIASTALGTAPLAMGMLAVAVLFIAQVVVSRLRRATNVEGAVDNTPLLLMFGAEVLDEHLARARLTRDDLRAKLRAANVLDPSDVRAVVLETTGDVSVLQGGGPLHPRLLEGVRCGPVDPGADAH